MIVHVLGHSAQHTTARYLASCARSEGFEVRYESVGRLPLTPDVDDLLLYVDPGPEQLPFGLEAVPCRTVAFLIDVHMTLPLLLDLAQLFDQVFIAQKDYLTEFWTRGHPGAKWLPLGCDPAIHFVPGQERDLDVAFVGNLGIPGTARHKILRAVLPKFYTNDLSRFLDPTEMGRVYSRAKIVFNTSIRGDVNMRVFEAIGAGALLVTDRIGNGLNDLLTEGQHYVGYSTPEEAIEVITHFLGDDVERTRIARAGQAHVFEHHTYLHRWRTLLATTQAQPPGSRPIAMTRNGGEVYGRILERRRDLGGLLRLMNRDGCSQKHLVHLAVATLRLLRAKVIEFGRACSKPCDR